MEALVVGPRDPKLIHALMTGEVYDGSEVSKSSNSNDWPVISAETIRDLLRGKNPAITPDPRGLRLRSVRVRGRLNLDRVETRIALELDVCDLPDGISAEHSQLSRLALLNLTIDSHAQNDAVVNLEHAKLEHLELTGTTLIHCKGPALLADGSTITSKATFNGGFTAESSHKEGTISLIGATIHGELDMEQARLINTTGHALRADGIQVIGSVYLDNGFTAESSGASDSVRLIGATITGQLHMATARLICYSGSALAADRLHVKNSVFLDMDFIAESRGRYGTVSLVGATIKGDLFIKARLTNHGGPVITSREARIGGKLKVYVDLQTAPKSRIVDLRRTSVSGSFSAPRLSKSLPDNPEAIRGTWKVTGLRYGTLGSHTRRNWLKFLRHGTREYSPQPYQQFAALALRDGDEKLARKALIAQQDDHLWRSKRDGNLLRGTEKVKKIILKCTVGYGYRQRRVLPWLIGIVIFAFAFMLVGQQGVFPWFTLMTSDPVTEQPTGEPCSVTDITLLTFSVFPLLDDYGTQCAPDAGRGLYVVVTAFFKIICAALLAVFIAGFTSIVRRPADY